MAKDLKIYTDVIKHSWMYQLAIFLTFVVTLSVFPAVTLLVEPIQKGRQITYIHIRKKSIHFILQL